MRLGGPARYVIEVEQPGEVPQAYNFAAMQGLPVFILGYGANTIGKDEGYAGVIVINRMRGIQEVGGDGFENLGGGGDGGGVGSDAGSDEGSAPVVIKAMGGENWDTVVEYTTARGLTGIEALSKIPGLVGAAPVQNIGAYGQEIADTLVSIDVYDTVTGAFRTLMRAELGLAYRKSILNTTERGRYFVIAVTLALRRGQMRRPFYKSIEQYVSEHGVTDLSPQGVRAVVSAIRASKLPDPLVAASAGSFFKNIYLSAAEAEVAEGKGYPVYRGRDGNKINAGWLIEQAGFKGQLLHGMRVSETAALVLINESAKSYADLARARGEIVSKVYDKFGYWLEQEPVEIG